MPFLFCAAPAPQPWRVSETGSAPLALRSEIAGTDRGMATTLKAICAGAMRAQNLTKKTAPASFARTMRPRERALGAVTPTGGAGTLGTSSIVEAATSSANQPLTPQARTLTLVEILTVGLPFCVFKLACGVPLLARPHVAAVGWALIALGVADAALNGLNGVWVGALGRRRLPVCCLQALLIALRPSARSGNVGTALDMMLSFTLVAAMIGSGALGLLPPRWLSAWNVAVVLNVLGAGALRLADALIPARGTSN